MQPMSKSSVTQSNRAQDEINTGFFLNPCCPTAYWEQATHHFSNPRPSDCPSVSPWGLKVTFYFESSTVRQKHRPPSLILTHNTHCHGNQWIQGCLQYITDICEVFLKKYVLSTLIHSEVTQTDGLSSRLQMRIQHWIITSIKHSENVRTFSSPKLLFLKHNQLETSVPWLYVTLYFSLIRSASVLPSSFAACGLQTFHTSEGVCRKAFGGVIIQGLHSTLELDYPKHGYELSPHIKQLAQPSVMVQLQNCTVIFKTQKAHTYTLA